MRVFIVAVTALLLSACRLSLDAALDPIVTCDGNNSGRNGSNGSCTPDNHGPGGIVIIIGPSRQYSDGADTLCYQFSPMPAQVTTGGSYSFQNNTNSTVTIQGANQQSWVTVVPGATSGALSFSSAGTYTFGIQGCRGMEGSAAYGVVNVTQN
jgi:hypothetical protein